MVYSDNGGVHLTGASYMRTRRVGSAISHPHFETLQGRSGTSQEVATAIREFLIEGPKKIGTVA